MTSVTENERTEENKNPGSKDPGDECCAPTDKAIQTAESVPPNCRIRYRIRFAKTGLLRWISHRDLARLWERLLRRAELKLSMTEGFHPKPRVSFPSALALGVESLDEVVEIELAEAWKPVDLLEKFRADNQPGLTINSVCQLPDRFGKAQLKSTDYQISLPTDVDIDAVQRAITGLKAAPTISIRRKQKTVTIDVAAQILDLQLVPDALLLTLAASHSATLRPGDVLDALHFGDWIENGSTITRVKVVLENEFESEDPEAVATATASAKPTET